MKYPSIVLALAVCSFVSNAQTNFTVDGTLVIRDAGVDPRNVLNTFDKIRFTGITSDYGIAVQDGNGRVNHYWNASGGGSPTYLISNEEAGRIRLHPYTGD